MRSLAFRLILGFLAVSLTGIALIGLLASRFSTQEFGAFAERQTRDMLMGQLVSFYREHGSWMGAELIRMSGDTSATGANDQAVADLDGKVVLAGGNLAYGQVAPSELLSHGIPIVVDGKVVGTLLPFPAGFNRPPPGGEFIDRIRRNLGLSVLGAGLLSLILGVVLARTLTRPLRDLTEATQAIAAGDFTHRVPVRRRDEMGLLGESFNRMSAELARAQSLRLQVTADVAHELRTPLGVILGHAEALADGVIPPSPETFTMIHDEAKRLARLVEDLRMLSLTDAGELTIEPVRIEPSTLLERAARAAHAEASDRGIDLQVRADPTLPALLLDPDRMAQVLDNLLTNSLRYTPKGGRIVLAASRQNGDVILDVEDNGPGVPAEDLQRIFERFYRVDASRGRPSGGSGLGLAIAKSLVETQGGRMWAESPAGGGLSVRMAFPISLVVPPNGSQGSAAHPLQG